jgi:2-polyprenyl-3-methyl-5-hydroxy-6-metoxy-1,4-benzoquinol methylase
MRQRGLQQSPAAGSAMGKKKTKKPPANEWRTREWRTRSPRSSYRYPDKGDRITRSFIGRSEPYPGYWQESEDRALADFYAYCKQKKRKALLDIGAGEGRLALRLSTCFEEVTALEPDPGRLAQAKSAARRADIRNIRFVEKEFLSFEAPSEFFDAVVISHVIQHIETIAVPTFFKKAHSLLKDGGKLIVMTSHARRSSAISFSKSLMKGDRILDVSINQEEFDQLVVNRDGVLPVRFFSFQMLREMLSPIFHIENERVFHELFKRISLDRFIFRDTLGNVPWVREFFGRDMLVEARKK